MNLSNIEWKCKYFEQLDTRELYEILHIRDKVFIIEQQCLYLDADGNDYHCLHLCGYEEGELVAYARILPPGHSYREVSIGRVACIFEKRGKGLGKKLMELALLECERHFPGQSIKISAQSYLIDFYKFMGFLPIGEPYLEDQIPHQSMILKK
jgi:ElaA protein